MNSTELIARARDAGSYTSRKWSPSVEGDLVAGTVVRFEYVTTVHGESLVLKVDATEVMSDGERLPPGMITLWEKTMLKQALLDKRVCIRDAIAIIYDGEEQAGKGKNPAKKFSVHVEKTDESFPYKEPAGMAERTKRIFQDEAPF